MSSRFVALASDAKNADANSAAVCGVGLLKSSRTVRVRGFVTRVNRNVEHIYIYEARNTHQQQGNLRWSAGVQVQNQDR